MADSVRVYTKDLESLSPTGSECEVCGRHMGLHWWVDLDENGFVTDCNYALS